MSEAKFTTAYSDLAGFTGIKRNGEDIGLDEAATLLNDMYEALCDMASDRECLSEATVNFAKAALAKAQGE